MGNSRLEKERKKKEASMTHQYSQDSRRLSDVPVYNPHKLEMKSRSFHVGLSTTL